MVKKNCCDQISHSVQNADINKIRKLILKEIDAKWKIMDKALSKDNLIRAGEVKAFMDGLRLAHAIVVSVSTEKH